MTEEQDKQTVSAPAVLSVDARQVLADQLVEQAKTDGISLIEPPWVRWRLSSLDFDDLSIELSGE